MKRVLVIGLDAADYRFIDPLLRSGRLPNLQKLISSGSHGTLRSTVPPHSAPAWVTMTTGENPGKHGILGWRNLNLAKYTCFDERLVDSSLYAGKTIFDYLSARDKKVIAFGVPATFPPWKINGVMVAGYPTPDERVAYTYPEGLSKRISPLLDVKIDTKLAMDVEQQMKSYFFEADRLTEVMTKLGTEIEFDLFFLVIGILDSACHTYWKFLDQNNPNYSVELSKKYGDNISILYQKIDECIGQLLTIFPKELTVFVVSDHGSCPKPRKYVNLNFWLKDEGLLKEINHSKFIGDFLVFISEWAKENLPIRDFVKKKFPKFAKERISLMRQNISIDWGKTVAYRVPFYYPFEGINLNLENRQPKGIVGEDDYRRYRKQIVENIKDLRCPYTGNQIVKSVFLKEDIFAGENLHNIPDIILEIDPHYDWGAYSSKLITHVPKSFLNKYSGYHSLDGVFIACGKNILHNPNLLKMNIIDVAPTILFALGEDIPANMDGSPILSVFKEDFIQSNASKQSDVTPPFTKDSDLRGYDKDDHENLKRALRSLGYIE
ncbi:MAG: hypothetical protein AMJ43_10370 [Coxiella sp. DG_40]|nr:MAG: hypothetical protein AMJ43_10370 [Coxiella sp. DG_40]